MLFHIWQLSFFDIRHCKLWESAENWHWKMSAIKRSFSGSRALQTRHIFLVFVLFCWHEAMFRRGLYMDIFVMFKLSIWLGNFTSCTLGVANSTAQHTYTHEHTHAFAHTLSLSDTRAQTTHVTGTRARTASRLGLSAPPHLSQQTHENTQLIRWLAGQIKVKWSIT